MHGIVHLHLNGVELLRLGYQSSVTIISMRIN